MEAVAVLQVKDHKILNQSSKSREGSRKGRLENHFKGRLTDLGK